MSLAPIDYEARTLDVVRALLLDIQDAAEAEYKIRWIEGAPHLILGFTLKATGCVIPSFGIRLSKMPSGTLLEGDALRRHVRDGFEQYLEKHGVKVTLSI